MQDRLRPQPASPVVLAVIALAAVAVACGGSAADSPEPRIHWSSPNHAVTLTSAWRIELVDTGMFSLAPVELGQVGISPDGRVAHVGTSTGRLVAADVRSGNMMWEADFEEPVDGQPVVRGNRLYVGVADGGLHALSSSGGADIWRYHAGGNVDSAPAATDDVVVVARADGTVVCLDSQTGAPRWTVADDDPILRVTRGLYPPVKGQASPSIVGDRVYTGFPSGRLAALGLDDGRLIWTADLAADSVRHTDVDEAPVVIADTVYAASFSGGLYALEGETGRILWRHDVRGATRPVPYGQGLLTTTVDGHFVHLDRETGAVRFRIRLDDRAPGPIQLVGDYAVVATSQGALYVLDAETPHIHARFSPSAGFASVAAGPNGRLVALDNHGVLHGLVLRIQ